MAVFWWWNSNHCLNVVNFYTLLKSIDSRSSPLPKIISMSSNDYFFTHSLMRSTIFFFFFFSVSVFIKKHNLVSTVQHKHHVCLQTNAKNLHTSCFTGFEMETDGWRRRLRANFWSGERAYDRFDELLAYQPRFDEGFWRKRVGLHGGPLKEGAS